MPYTLEKLPDAPIVVVVSLPGADLVNEVPALMVDVNRLLDEQESKVFLIIDVSRVSMGLDDIMRGASLATRGQGTMLHHRNIRENVFVVADSLLTMAVNGLSTATFGQVRLKQFATIEEGMDYCREQIQAGQI